MCQTLNLNNNISAKRNDQRFTVEHFYPFLNKSITIAAEERSTNDIFVPTSIAADYTYNSVSINGADVLCGIPAIGREFYFLIDINLSSLFNMTQINVQAALEYLKLTDSSSHFSSSILNLLLRTIRPLIQNV